MLELVVDVARLEVDVDVDELVSVEEVVADDDDEIALIDELVKDGMVDVVEELVTGEELVVDELVEDEVLDVDELVVDEELDVDELDFAGTV